MIRNWNEIRVIVFGNLIFNKSPYEGWMPESTDLAMLKRAHGMDLIDEYKRAVVAEVIAQFGEGL